LLRRFLFSAKDTCRGKTLAHAQDSFHGLRRQPSAELPLSRRALASVAIPIATTAFQYAPSHGAQFCALDSRFRHRSFGDVANSNCDCDLGTRAAGRVIELDSPSDMGCCDRDLPFDGLRLLVVALGHAYGAGLLAISQRASYRPGYGREHGCAISLRRNDSFHRLSLISRRALWYRPDHAGRVLRQF